MKLCFIGNSHVAAVKLGWNALQISTPGVEIEFFGARGRRLDALKLDGRSLVSNDPAVTKQLELTSGGQSAIEIDRYDGFALVGLNFGLSRALKVFAKHRSLSTVGAAPHRHLVSEAAIDLAVRGMVESSEAYGIAAMIRKVDQSKPIVVAPTPNPSTGITADKSLYWIDAEPLAVRIAPTFEAAVADFRKTLGVVVLSQPAETVERGCFTKPAYGEGSIRLGATLDAAHPEEEFKHMNADFGALVLKGLLSRFGTAA